MKKISLQTIADDFGVSKVTVHKALKNQPGVRPELKERIQSYASQIGYSTHDPIISKKHFLYIIDKKYFLSYEQFYTKIYYYLNNEIERNHGKITLLIYDGQPFYLSKIKEINGIDCILLAGETDDELMRLLGETDYPVITIDFLSNRFPFDYIYINNYYSSMLATNYLIEQGHKKIGMVVDPLSANSNTDRFFGYQKALMLNSIPYHPEWLIDRNIEHYDIKDFDLPKEMPTAFICHCDKAAQQLYTKIKSETDLVIGEDVSIISFDNTDLCESLTPKLTSVGLSLEKIASIALKLAIYRLNNPDAEKVKRSLYPDITVRESVKNLGSDERE